MPYDQCYAGLPNYVYFYGYCRELQEYKKALVHDTLHVQFHVAMDKKLNTPLSRKHIHSDPFRSDPENAPEFYNALGRAVVLWGKFESFLDNTLLSIVNLPQSNGIKPDLSKMPNSLKGKLKLLRQFVCKIADLEVLKERTKCLVDDAFDSAEDRHVIVHGHFNGFVAHDPLKARFVHSRSKKDQLLISQYDITTNELENMVQTFDALNNRLVQIMLYVINLHTRIGN